MNILITGATGNLGTSVVGFFLAKGHKVFALVSPRAVLDEKAVSNLFYRKVDLRDEDAVARIIENIVQANGQLDAVILLAGGFAMGDLANSSLEEIHKMTAINFDTAYTVTRASYQVMSKQIGGGKIVFVGAKPAIEASTGGAMLGYTLSKTMLVNLATILNHDSAATKIFCSVIIPSIIDTPANRQAMPNVNFSEWLSPKVIAQKLEEILQGKLQGNVLLA